MNIDVELQVPLITLVGPPNSGKTTLFNLLSGKNYKTVNYPGSTVEYHKGKILPKYNLNTILLDSPGIISLIPESPDEQIAVNSLYKHPAYGTPNLIICTIDSCQLSRHLLLPKQLIHSGFKVIIVLTMIDILEKKGLKVSEKKLREELNCDVVSINGRTGQGVEKLIQAIQSDINETSNEKSYSIIAYNEIANNGLMTMFNEIERVVEKVYEPTISENLINLGNANNELAVIQENIKSNGLSPDSTTLLIKYCCTEFGAS